MKKIILKHYSNNEIKDKIKTSYFANNSYTFNDLLACKIKRSFFYCENSIIEYLLKNCKYIYYCEIDYNKCYDLTIDKQNLKTKFNYNINGLLNYLKKRFTCVIYNIGDLKIAISFKDLKIKNVVKNVL